MAIINGLRLATAVCNSRRQFISTVVLLLAVLTSRADETNSVKQPSQDLTQIPITDLMNIPVVSVSRTAEKLSTASAAIAVLTQDDIRRSGATSIPEALRLVPGLEVARVDSHTWAISSRGFNDVFANKLLVMIDGRTVYTPLFSGVFWDVQDTMIEDIDRIEVVRGPGATLWGANAVNGVINIITKSAKDTQGVLISGGAGTEERGFASARYGMKLADNAFLKVYGKWFDRDSSALPNGTQNHDRWDVERTGFRLDWEPREVNTITLQGDLYTGNLDQNYSIPPTPPSFATNVLSSDNVAGGNFLGRWSHHFSEDSELTVQAYYDRTVRNTAVFGETRDTGDIDFQHRLGLGERQELIWGVGFRSTHDDVRNTPNVSLIPNQRTTQLYSAFVQDEISVLPDLVRVTLGSKFEHNDFTGFEVQPSLRGVWTPAERHTVWASVSRAVRTPSRAEDDVVIDPAGVPPGAATLFGNRNFISEEVIAYEIGYRVQPFEKLTFDLTGFYNDYDHLRSLEPNGTNFQRVAANGLRGETYGAEVSTAMQLTPPWRLTAGYTYLNLQIHRRPGSLDSATEATDEGSSPHHQIFVRNSFDIGKHVQLDAFVRYVDQLNAVSITPTVARIPSYVTMDVRLAWQPRKNVELSIVGQNLLDDRHPEFSPTFVGTQQAEVERGVYGKITIRF